MSKRTFLCWACRTAYRSDIHTGPEMRVCAECGESIHYVSEKVEIPPKADVAAWHSLRASLLERQDRVVHEQRVNAVRRIHHLEKQIAELRSRPENPGRKSAIQLLEKQLAELRAR